ncbi:phosphoribosylanthranilate isomerase [Rubinisphaera margarita]|uniref:phosphoribosylanthranilate isomerase n=1 Tax=Rubinisphaera margarita TaxID=2909586 RepID=UPI001EE8B804|nr:phosphoribosylanthranilate isomerase [Rubinisphaera margarita]MCG6157863.1 phosphoribosylanthranilate isomerase [Rubinisphaera margarita]
MWIKICGLRVPEEAPDVVAAAPDAIGLNFYAGTPRFVTEETAAAISAQIPDEIARVGVFVDTPPDEIDDLAERLQLDHVQLHGDYTAADAARLAHRSLIWVHRLGTDGLDPLRNELKQLAAKGVQPFACLIDASVPGQFGGSGKTVDWPALATGYDRDTLPPLILAGGLVPENIGDAITAVSPWGVDTASGVERDGRKSRELVAGFVRNARGA